MLNGIVAIILHLTPMTAGLSMDIYKHGFHVQPPGTIIYQHKTVSHKKHTSGLH